MLGVASVLLRACSSTLAPARLVSLWPFDEVSGASTDFEDLGPGNVPMTIVGSWADLNSGSLVRDLAGTSAYTDGSAYAILPANQAAHDLSALTISLYYQRESAAAKQTILAVGTGSQPGDLSIEVQSNGMLRGWHTGQDGELRFFDGSSGVVGTNLQVGTAYRIDLTLGRQGARLYLDGVALAAAVIPANVNGWNNDRTKYLARWTDGDQSPAIGAFDHMRIWDRQMVAEEIALLDLAQSLPASVEFSCLIRPSGSTISVPTNNNLYAHNGPAEVKYDAFHGGSPSIWTRSLTGTAHFLNQISGSDGGCWSGGACIGTQPRDRVRSGTGSFGNSCAMIFGVSASVSGFLAEGMRVDNWWDTTKLAFQHNAENITLRGWWISHCRDDAWENDNGRAGFVVDDTLVDGTYSGFSGRGSGDFSGQTSTLNKCLLRMEPQPTAPGYNLRSHGHIGAFKMNGGSVRVDLFDCIFAWQEGTASPVSDDIPGVSDDPLYDLLRYNKLRTSSGNRICWLGAGGYPSGWWVPPGFTVLTGTEAQETWDNAVAAWKTAHPLVYRIPGVDV